MTTTPAAPKKLETKTMPRTDGTANKESTTESKTTTTGTAPDGSPTKVTTSTSSDEYKTQFVKVYQDAGVIGVSMLTLLVLCLLMGWILLRVLKLYIGMAEGREKAEALRLEYFDKLTTAVIDVKTDVAGVKSELKAEHATHVNDAKNTFAVVKTMSDRLDSYLFSRQKGGETK